VIQVAKRPERFDFIRSTAYANSMGLCQGGLGHHTSPISRFHARTVPGSSFPTLHDISPGVGVVCPQENHTIIVYCRLITPWVTVGVSIVVGPSAPGNILIGIH